MMSGSVRKENTVADGRTQRCERCELRNGGLDIEHEIMGKKYGNEEDKKRLMRTKKLLFSHTSHQIVRIYSGLCGIKPL